MVSFFNPMISRIGMSYRYLIPSTPSHYINRMYSFTARHMERPYFVRYPWIETEVLPRFTLLASLPLAGATAVGYLGKAAVKLIQKDKPAALDNAKTGLRFVAATIASLAPALLGIIQPKTFFDGFQSPPPASFEDSDVEELSLPSPHTPCAPVETSEAPLTTRPFQSYVINPQIAPSTPPASAKEEDLGDLIQNLMADGEFAVERSQALKPTSRLMNQAGRDLKGAHNFIFNGERINPDELISKTVESNKDFCQYALGLQLKLKELGATDDQIHRILLLTTQAAVVPATAKVYAGKNDFGTESMVITNCEFLSNGIGYRADVKDTDASSLLITQVDTDAWQVIRRHAFPVSDGSASLPGRPVVCIEQTTTVSKTRYSTTRLRTWEVKDSEDSRRSSTSSEISSDL